MTSTIGSSHLQVETNKVMFIGGCVDGYVIDMPVVIKKYTIPFFPGRITTGRPVPEEEKQRQLLEMVYTKRVISNIERTKTITVMAKESLSVDQVMCMLATRTYKINPLLD